MLGHFDETSGTSDKLYPVPERSDKPSGKWDEEYSALSDGNRVLYNRTMKALRAADAAGNTEDAKKLAHIVVDILEWKKPKENLGVLPFLNKTIAAGLGFPMDFGLAAMSIIPGVKVPDIKAGTKFVEKGMKKIGIEFPKEGRQATTIPEHMGVTVAETALLLLPFLKGAQVLTKGVGLTSKIARQIVKSTAKHPYLTAASEITAGMGAGTGRGVGEQNFADSPGKKIALELTGGIIGGMAPTAFMHSPTMLAGRLLHKMSLPFTAKGSKYRAGEFIKGAVADPEKVIGKLEKETLADLSPAVVSGEKKLLALYKSFLRKDPVADADVTERIGQSIFELEKQMRKLGYGSPELLAEVAQKRANILTLGMDKRILEATEKAQKKIDGLSVASRKTHESRIVRNELEDAMAFEHRKNKGLWAKVPKDFEIGTENTRAAYDEIKADLPHAQKQDIPDVLTWSFIFKKDQLRTTLKELQGLRSKLLETARIARKDGQWNKARIANDVSDAILEDIGISSSGQVSPAARSLQVALAGTKQYKKKFEQGIVGKILGFEKSGAPAIDPDITLDVSVGRRGTKGSLDIDKVAVTPEAKEAVNRYVARSFTDYSLDSKGKVVPSKADTWINNNEAILDKLPDLQKQLGDINEAQKLATETKSIEETAKKALSDPKISLAAMFLKMSSMDDVVNSILKSPKAAKMTAKLVELSKHDPSGKALEGLRGGFIEKILDKSSTGGFNDAGERILSGKALLNFVNRESPALSHVFLPEQMSRMRSIGRELAKLEKFTKMTPDSVGVQMQDIASSGLQLLGSVGGAQFGRMVSKATGGGTIQTPGIFASRFRKIATFLSRDKALQLIQDAITDPDPTLLKALLLPIDKPKIAESNLKILTEAITVWLSGAGKRVVPAITAPSNGVAKNGGAH